LRRLQHPGVTMGEPTPRWALGARGLEASARMWGAHGHGAPRVSGALEGNEGQGEGSGVGWSNSAPPSALHASPVKRAIGALPGRLPLVSRRWFWENMIKLKVAWVMGPVELLRDGRRKALTSSTSAAAGTMASSFAKTIACSGVHCFSRRPSAPSSPCWLSG
jgi:hypothetical protein